jgi:hypothetical protein
MNALKLSRYLAASLGRYSRTHRFEVCISGEVVVVFNNETSIPVVSTREAPARVC